MEQDSCTFCFNLIPFQMLSMIGEKLEFSLLIFGIASWLFMMMFIILGPIIMFDNWMVLIIPCRWYRYYFAAPNRAAVDTTFLPSVSILRPLKGMDANLETNLASSFLQDYPNYEIVFSLETSKDPAYQLVLKLMKRYPDVKCSIVLGMLLLILKIRLGLVDVGMNPKVNNLVKAFGQSQS